MPYESVVPPPPPTAPTGAKSGSSWLTGCLAGCGLLILLILIGGAFASWWAFTPGQQYATDAIWNDRAVAYFRMDDILADEGAKAVIVKAWQAMVEADNRQKREALPENMGWLADLDKGSQQNPAGLGMFMPSQLSVVVMPPPEGELEGGLVAAMNFRTMVRPFKSFLLWAAERDDREQGRPVDYKGFPIVDMDHGNYLTFADSTVIFGSSLPALQAALDRIADGSVAEVQTIELPEGRWDLIGRSSNKHGGVETLLAQIEAFANNEIVFEDEEVDAGSEVLDETEVYEEGLVEEEPELEASVIDPPAENPADLAQLGDATLDWGVDFVSADRATCKFRLRAPVQDLEAWRQRIDATMTELWKNFSKDGLKLESRLEIQGDVLEGELQLDGMAARIDQFFYEIVPEYETAG